MLDNAWASSCFEDATASSDSVQVKGAARLTVAMPRRAEIFRRLLVLPSVEGLTRTRLMPSGWIGVDSAQSSPVLCCEQFDACKWREKSRTLDLAAFRRVANKGPHCTERCHLWNHVRWILYRMLPYCLEQVIDKRIDEAAVSDKSLWSGLDPRRRLSMVGNSLARSLEVQR